jgi:chromosome partitioning protein
VANVSRETTGDSQYESAGDFLRRMFGTGESSVGMQLANESGRYKAVMKAKFPHPQHTRIIAVANQKGGVGKTTSAVNIAAAFAERKFNVLVLDMDPQGNASTALGIRHESGSKSIYDVIEGRLPISEVVQTCPQFPTLRVVPSTIDLSGAELEIANLDNRVNLLKDALNTYLQSQDAPSFDYVIIDCAPSLGLLVLNALQAAQEVMIPIQAEYYALEGLGQLLKTIQLVQMSYNPQLIISTMLITMYDRRTMLSKDVYDEVKKHYPHTLLKTVIPRGVRVSEAPSHAQTVISYNSRSAGAIAYREAALEIALRGDPHDNVSRETSK